MKAQVVFPSILARKDREAFLKNLARDNTQLLFNAIWKVLFDILPYYLCRVFFLHECFSLFVFCFLAPN